MLRFTSLLALGLLANAASAQAQVLGTQFGVKSGLSLAVFDGTLNKYSDYKPGLHVGGFLRYRPSARFALQPELVYARQGSKTQTELFVSGVTLKSQTKLSYLNVPVLAKVYLGDVVHLHAGPQFGLLLSAREVGQTGYQSTSSGNRVITTDADVKKEYKSDVALCLGIGADFPMGLSLSARANYGFSDINKNEAEKQARTQLGIGGLHNRVLEFSLGYAFGGR